MLQLLKYKLTVINYILGKNSKHTIEDNKKKQCHKTDDKFLYKEILLVYQYKARIPIYRYICA